ncbi:MAG: beta-hydroxyacyl-ACP dehydratase [Prevotellaceae bacterium]|nr:beta-hydroxyacyl-ACP dehydratase [Prevotellaceae bacterium]
MLLENKFYRIMGIDKDDERRNAVFHLAILPDCEVYEGHFPGNPICPGVCNIETIRECASLFIGHDMRIRMIKQCRLVAIASPAICPEVDVTINISSLDDNTFIVAARIEDKEKTYIDFKGEMAI